MDGVSRRQFLSGVVGALATATPGPAATRDAFADLSRVQRGLRKLGYRVEALIADPPLRVAGQPAIVYALADEHTAPGGRFVLQAVKDLLRLRPLTTLLQEGIAFSAVDQREGARAVAEYERRLKTMPVATVAEATAAGIVYEQTVPDAYQRNSYARTAGFKQVIGIERDLVGIRAIIDCYVGARSLVSYANFSKQRGLARFPMMVDRKFVQEAAARAFFASGYLRDSFPDVPHLNARVLLATAKGPDGKEHELELWTADAPEIRALWTWVQAKLATVSAARSVIAAGNTEAAFTHSGIPHEAAAIFGRDHLRHALPGPTYPELLKARGVSSLTIFPGPKMPTAGE